MSVTNIIDLCLHVALASVGVAYRGEEYCSFPVSTFLIASGCVSSVFALVRLLDSGPQVVVFP
jgi:hypothetical protein